MGFYITILLFVITMGVLDNSNLRIPYAKTITFIVLWFAAGMSNDFGIDNPAYHSMYYNTTHPSVESSIEPVWLWFSDAMRSIGFTSRIFFMTASFFTMLGFFYGIKKLSDNFWISLTFFIACYFYFESTNGIRQYLAMAIIFAATPWAKQGGLKILYYLLAVILAGQFHPSAYVMIPMIFFCKIKFPEWLLASVMLITFAIGSQLMGIMISVAMSFLNLGKFEAYTENIFLSGVSSGLMKVYLNFLGMLVILTSKRMKEASPQSYLFINMVIVGIVIYNIFYQFQAVMRLYWYFYPFIIILIPLLLKSFTQRSKYIITGALLLFFATFALKMLYELQPDYSFDLILFQ